jgi:hypothetical protein
LGSSTGIISGMPTAPGLSTFTASATNAGGSSFTQLSMTVNFTYYVDSANGSDSNPGTEANPWQTIGRSAN